MSRFVPLKDRFGEVEAAFAAPVTAVLKADGITEEEHRELDVEKEKIGDDGHWLSRTRRYPCPLCRQTRDLRLRT